MEQPSGRFTTQVPITQIVQVREIAASENVLKVSPDWNGSTLQKQISGHGATCIPINHFKNTRLWLMRTRDTRKPNSMSENQQKQAAETDL